MARGRPVLSMALVAIVVALVDLVIKLCALTLLGERSIALTSWLGFEVHLNGQMAWGLAAGISPALLTFGATLAIVALGGLVARELITVDRWTPIAFGLIAGAGIANAFDGLIPPPGAVDFIVVAHSGIETVLNGADFAVLMGLAICCRTTVLLGMAIDRERGRTEQPALRVPAFAERVVSVPLHSELARIEPSRRAPADERRPTPPPSATL
jgi:lipoprotein signal peptidase